jgi:hypothetical protein
VEWRIGYHKNVREKIGRRYAIRPSNVEVCGMKLFGEFIGELRHGYKGKGESLSEAAARLELGRGRIQRLEDEGATPKFEEVGVFARAYNAKEKDLMVSWIVTVGLGIALEERVRLFKTGKLDLLATLDRYLDAYRDTVELIAGRLEEGLKGKKS